jgi:hypothetical protein
MSFCLKSSRIWLNWLQLPMQLVRLLVVATTSKMTPMTTTTPPPTTMAPWRLTTMEMRMKSNDLKLNPNENNIQQVVVDDADADDDHCDCRDWRCAVSMND